MYPGGSGRAGAAEFTGFFVLGSLIYSKKAADGIDLSYQDENEVTWSTSFGTGDQTGSVFEI